MTFRKWSASLVGLLLVLVACGGTAGTTTTAEVASTTPTTAGEEPLTTTAAPDTSTTATGTGEGLTFGMILVGPQDDHGWSQAHYEAGLYMEEQLGAEMIVLDKVNGADRPDTTVEQVVDDMVSQGAQLIFATSDDMRDGILAGAANHPDVPMIWSSGDSAWAEGEAYEPDLTNLGNIMGEMEFGKMMAGCAAALTTQTGSIGFVGPLINDETRRLANAAYLGARYCYENYRGEDPNALQFAVNWIGFWFNIPGVTLDPTNVTNEFIDGGADVLISGIDTTEALVRTGQRAEAGESVWAIPYDFRDACDQAPDACLGVPFFNWGPSYVGVGQSVIDGTFTPDFQWLGPDWADINNPETSMIGFTQGPALSAEAATSLDEFTAGLADGSINLWTGPLNYQDGSPFLADGEEATPEQIWYTEQLLEGMEGASSAE
ncbi:MAG: BMP family ABC transporter substrate-binding protein [Actinobacteria bacterium]|nr:BMP family ABC transporter substrate-binding protein [Actinomycetota bacterium]